MLIIILKTIVCSGILLGLYYLFLAKEKTFTFNRFYLIFALVFSYSIPFISIERELPETDLQPSLLAESAVQQTVIQTLAPVEESFDYTLVFMTLYTIIGVFFLLKLMYSVWKVKKIKGEKIYYRNRSVVILEKQMAPFSFMNTIYIPESHIQNNSIDENIFLHEEIHIAQKHSFDILLVEILKAALWFNPFIYIYKKAMAANHEFIADEKVIRNNNNIKDYQNLILNEILRQQNVDLVHHFNFNNTKKRFIMMTQKNSKFAQVKKYLSIPVFAALAVIFAEKAYAAIPYSETDIHKSPIFQTIEKAAGNPQDAQSEIMEILNHYDAGILKDREGERFKKEVSREDQVKLAELFRQINAKDYHKFPVMVHYHEINREIPTSKQLTQFLSKDYNILLDNKSISNDVLKNYKNTDFYSVYTVKVLPKNSDYGKYKYGVVLYTTGYAKKFNSQKNIIVGFPISNDEYQNLIKNNPNSSKEEVKPAAKEIQKENNPENHQVEATLIHSEDQQEKTPAEFPGGYKELMNKFVKAFNGKTIKGDHEALRSTLYMTINEKGEVTNTKAEGQNEIFNQEISRIFKQINENITWKPATENGKAVSTIYKLPIMLNNK